MNQIEKLFISANELLDQSFELAELVHKHSFAPTIVVGVWRGGAPIAVAVHEYLAVHDSEIDHAVISAKSYTGVDQRSNRVEISGLDTLQRILTSDSRVLLVDDIFDTGKTMEGIIQSLRLLEGLQTLAIKVACAWYKPSRNLTSIEPDFYVKETERWVVFPHELVGLSDQELERHKSRTLMS